MIDPGIDLGIFIRTSARASIRLSIWASGGKTILLLVKKRFSMLDSPIRISDQ